MQGRSTSITTLTRIPSDEIRFHPHSFFEPGIRLFEWKGQLYRGISSERALFFRELFKNGIVQSLIKQRLLIESELTPLAVEGYDMVVHHRKIAFASYPNEWCAAMLKDGALGIVDLALELAHQGLALGDAHPWNLVFDLDTGRPVFVDLGSIGPLTDSAWPVYDEFCRFCLYPLILMTHGEDRIARLLMCEDSGVTASDISKLKGDAVLPRSSVHHPLLHRLDTILAQHVPLSYRTWLKEKLSALQRITRRQSQDKKPSPDPLEKMRQKSHVDFLFRVRREVESVSLPYTAPKTLGGRNISRLSLSDQGGWTAKQRSIREVLTDLKPSSLLDIGTNTGWYSKLAALSGIRVVSWDIDPMCTTQLYLDARGMQLPILPLIMDFTKPTPPRGWANHWAIAAAERFQCDMVLSLGLMHHFVHKNRLNFEQIVEGLAGLAKRWAVVEFIPPDDPEARHLQSTRTSWYTLENFVNALKKHFGSVRITPSHPETRFLLVCEK
jgi:hypothetical protein